MCTVSLPSGTRLNNLLEHHVCEAQRLFLLFISVKQTCLCLYQIVIRQCFFPSHDMIYLSKISLSVAHGNRHLSGSFNKSQSSAIVCKFSYLMDLTGRGHAYRPKSKLLPRTHQSSLSVHRPYAFTYTHPV